MSSEAGTSNIRIVKSPGESELEFVQMTAKEELGRPFEFELEVRSQNPNLKFEDLMGETLTVELEGEGEAHRYFNGYVCRFGYAGSANRHSAYRVSLRPWLWRLTRAAGCRIFQERTVPEIVAEVLGEFKTPAFEVVLTRQYRTWDYLVQYRETAFAFLSRLLEQEGIYYYFRHEKDRHVLVFADDLGAHPQAPVSSYRAPSASGEDPRFSEWHYEQHPQPRSYALKDFDFENPNFPLEVRSVAGSSPPGWDYEVFDYPGEYVHLSEGDAYVQERLEESETRREHVTFQSSVPGLAAGTVFRLTGHPRSDQNREYLVISAVHDLRWDPDFTGPSGSGERYRSSLVAIPSSYPFRPRQLTPKAVVQGPQTAIVVGPKDQKVWTDKYGRVKVRFHWDRRGKEDGNDSCWIRVSQGRAGSHWGAMQLPHVGQEVIVDFLEGDPDRPIITGCVYNAANMPPLRLPENRFRTVVARDHYGNAIIFDGTPGDEHIAIHSPHHNSGLVLGRSLGGSTASNDFSFGVGAKVDAHLGASLSLKLGAKADIDFAPGVSVQGGHRRDWQLGRVVTWTMRDRSQNCYEDYVVQVHGEQGALSISGDDAERWRSLKKPKKAATKRSMLYLDQEVLELSYGKNVPQSQESMWTPWHESAEATLYTALALALLTETASELVQEHDWVSDDWAKTLGAGSDSFQAGLVGTAAAISTIIAMLHSDQVNAQPNKDEWTSKVELQNNSLALDSKGRIHIGEGKATGVGVGNRKSCEKTHVYGKEILLHSKKSATINADKIQLG